ncbi:hypothetical protein L484_008404 [Morus notabilis]|uniref:WAT1-related protein n=1 Tax=Morus notabilis TaxID=981085 RepID=W9S8T6_9ROSA|nr:hypothetical protein L484_008404 [Morus notabilis]
MAGRNWKKEVGPFTAMASVESATDGKSEAVKLINSSENHRHHAFNIRCIDGSLHKGPTIISSASSSPSPRSPPSLQYPLETTQTNGITGGLLLVLQSLFSSIWYILQGVFGPSYDALLSTRVVHLKGPPYASIETTYGVFGPSYNSLLSTWVVHLKGPLYASIFKPFSIAIAAAFSVIFLGDSLFLGRYITVPLPLQVDSED